MQKYRYFNKYAGRQINVINFKQSLLSFLDNGTEYLIGLIPTILQDLEALRDIIANLTSLRWYASSLLLIYDGKPPHRVKIKMVDFSNCVSNADFLFENPDKVNFPPTKKGADLGYILGLSTLISHFEEIRNDFKHLANEDGNVSIKRLSNTQRINATMGL